MPTSPNNPAGTTLLGKLLNLGLSPGLLSRLKLTPSSQTAAVQQITPLKPPKLRHFFFAMPWVIRNEFDRFNNGDGKGEETGEQEEADNKLASKVQLKQHYLLPEVSFMKAVSQHRQTSIEPSSNSSSSKSSSLLKKLWYYFRPPPRQPIHLPNSPSSASPAQFLDFKRKVVLVGLHGWFPNRLLHHVIGDPRRTSDRIVGMMEAAVRAASDPFPPLIEGPAAIYKFPLHGDGTIEERLEKHYKELTRVADPYSDEGVSSMEHLRTADSVIIGAHSQGAPVSVMLLARLLDEGILDPGKQRITLFSAAGIFHGPFPPLRKNLVVQYVEAEAARQLFHLNDPGSEVSKRLLCSLDRVLQAGVNMTVIASWLDQVVPFYSACLLGIEHPNLWRAVHIDAYHYHPDFLTHLVQLGLKIKNLHPRSLEGEPETHMILAQISDFLAGSIYRDAMHSAGYKHASSYTTVLQWMFDGPACKGVPLKVIDHIRHRPLQLDAVNPYYLPWLFRGWLRNSELNSHPLLQEEFQLLRSKYEEWKPTSKALKDFKFQLEPITLLSKL